MSALTRYKQKIFGSTGIGSNPEQFKKFGGYAASDTSNAANPTVMQSLSAWLTGWFDEIDGDGFPAMEDMNSFCYVSTYQLAYLFEKGVAEWDSTTTYYAGSYVQVAGVLYKSLTNSNTGNDPTSDTTNWNNVTFDLAWSSTKTYALNDFVSSGGNLYVSLSASNVGNAVSDTTKWKIFRGGALNPQASSTLAIRAGGNYVAGSGADANAWRHSAYSPELGKLIAVAGTGTHRTMKSTDGITWSSITDTVMDAHSWRCVAWSPELGYFVALAASGTVGAYSSDGETWSASTVANKLYSDCIWVPDLGLFVACTTTNEIYTSPDGVNWTSRTSALTASSDLAALAWSPELQKIVCIAYSAGSGSNQVQYSSNGTSWTAVTAGGGVNFNDICWSPDLGIFAAIGQSGTHRVLWSRDGITWNTADAAAANTWESIAWSSELGLFVCVSVDGSSRVQYSFDGQTWYLCAAANANQWIDVEWYAELGRFVSLSIDGAAPTMASKYVGKFICA